MAPRSHAHRAIRPVRIVLDALALIGFGLTFLLFLWALGGAPLPGYPG